MLTDSERAKSLAETSEAIKAFDEYDQARRFIRSEEFQKHKDTILEKPVERAARLRKQGKAARSKRLNKKKRG